MKAPFRMFAVAICLFVNHFAFADSGCMGTGQYDATTGSCFYPDGSSSSYVYGNNAGYTDGENGSSQPRIVYLPPKPTQYGAVALNERTGAYGFSSNQATEKRSKQEAVNDCGENGCKIIAHYSNQCVAFAWGAVGNSGYSSVKVGLNKTTAEENALVSCHTGAANCSIIYSGCSLP